MRPFSHCKKAKLLLWPVPKSFTHRLNISFSAAVPSLQVPLRKAWSHQLLNCCSIHIAWGIGPSNSRPIHTNTNILCAICLGADVSVLISIWSSLQGISVFTVPVRDENKLSIHCGPVNRMSWEGSRQWEYESSVEKPSLAGLKVSKFNLVELRSHKSREAIPRTLTFREHLHGQ